MDLRQAFMLFTLAHAVGYYHLSSFKVDRRPWRLVVEILLYILAVALVFAPVLDGNNYLYALTIIVFHLVTAPLAYILGRVVHSSRARSILFFTVEGVTLAGFLVMAFFYSVRWGAFVPWRQVRFLLSSFGFSYEQVLAWAFCLSIALRPANIVVKKVLAAIGEEGEAEEGHISGAAVGVIERLCLLASALLGSWPAFGLTLCFKAFLFAMPVRRNPEWGMRVYVGTLLSVLFTLLPLAFAKPFF